HEDGKNVTHKTIESLLNWDPKAEPHEEISFTPARVLLQDYTGVPAIVDLAAMRDAIIKLGAPASDISPLEPVELVIDHSVQVDKFGGPKSLEQNTQIEFERNKERYEFLKWGQTAFSNFKVVPPSMGIVHQVNLEFLGRVVMTKSTEGETLIYPDTLVGTDSHTTMINGLGILGWGVGGIEAEACMLGQPTAMLLPQVVGFEFNGKLKPGVTATDLVLTVTQILRQKGVVGKFVEFFGKGLESLSLADRATVANMSPEYGATCGIFPVDHKTLDYLKLTARSEHQIELIETYMIEQGLFYDASRPSAEYSDTLALDLGDVEPSLAGPKRPQDRLSFSGVKTTTQNALENRDKNASVKVTTNNQTFELRHGATIIAAITSCTNTSNPSVLLAAGLLAKKAVEKGLKVPPWVKTSLAPGSRVVTQYLKVTGLSEFLDQLGFNTVGYGCTTCIGNSGPIDENISKAIDQNNLVVAAVLSGNRNFEGRVHPKSRVNYLASPPLVVAYALAGTTDIDLSSQALGRDQNNQPIYLKDLWPSPDDILQAMKSINAEMFKKVYADVFEGDELWKAIQQKTSETYPWDKSSTYIQHPPYFVDMKPDAETVTDIKDAKVLALLEDSITTDHISPAGAIPPESAAARYLQNHGILPKDFNSFGSRRGNHEVMVRGTFGNIRLKNQLVPGVEGSFTKHIPSGKQMLIFDASEKYKVTKTPLIILAGKEYGSGSSRDWAAKGPKLLGVRAVIAQSYERIHRSNLIGMGILPLQFKSGESWKSLGLSGFEDYNIIGIEKHIETFQKGQSLLVKARSDKGEEKSFEAISRIDTPMEAVYFKNDGILTYVLRQMAKRRKA
ncbi:MAG: aconitate hydratase AcnA, partial [Bdellovibrionales bacterium]|nr:aconitate hydratase AcnA [Bdellovibrionales bacterium]